MVKLSKDLTFESALAELEEITQKLEAGKDSLEDSMELYEKGMALKAFCQNQLKQAEGKWEVLKNKNGQVIAEEISSEKIPEPNELSDSQNDLF